MSRSLHEDPILGRENDMRHPYKKALKGSLI